MHYHFPRQNNERISAWFRRIASERKLGNPPESLEEELKQFSSDTMQFQLLLTLISDFRLRDDYANAEKLIQAEIETEPHNPRMRILLVDHYLYHSKELKKALAASDEALLEAKRSGMFVREVHGNRARLALHTNDHELLQQSVREIIHLGVLEEHADIPIERDFIDKAPQEAISYELRREFEELYGRCRRQGV